MSRKWQPDYTSAYKALVNASEATGLSPDAISDVLCQGINNNQIRMRGLLVDANEGQPSIEQFRCPKTTFRDLKELPRNLFKLSFRVVQLPVNFVYLLCDMNSNIFLSELESAPDRFTKVIVNAQLLNFDRDKVLNKALDWSLSGLPPGMKRADARWGEVILELLRRQARGGLWAIHTAKPIVDDFIKKFPNENPESIRSVLNYVLPRWAKEQKERARADKPASGAD